MSIKIIAKNKRASFDNFLEEKFEAGIVLKGTEVKVLRLGKVEMQDAHVVIDRGEAWIYNLVIPHYDFGNINNHEISRKKKLLLNSEEIKQIEHKMKTQQLNLIPTTLYFSKSLVKIEIALAKGKKLHDKREDKAKKDVERKLRRGIYD